MYDIALYLNRHASISSNEPLQEVWFEMTRWFWRRFLKFRHCIFALSLLSHFRKWCGPSFEEIEFPSPNDSLCQVWLKLAEWLWKTRRKCKTVYDNNDDAHDDNGPISIKKAHSAFGSGELYIHVSFMI